MALKATIFKTSLQLADLDRGHYADYALTLARHPSETDERMMVRLLAFALFADERLEFTRGLCADEEPELWQQELDGTTSMWIELGQPEEKRLRKACSRSRHVVVITYQPRSAQVWWQQNRESLQRLKNLTVISLPAGSAEALADLATRTMKLQCTIQDGVAWLSDGERSVEVKGEVLKESHD